MLGTAQWRSTYLTGKKHWRGEEGRGGQGRKGKGRREERTGEARGGLPSWPSSTRDRPVQVPELGMAAPCWSLTGKVRERSELHNGTAEPGDMPLFLSCGLAPPRHSLLRLYEPTPFLGSSAKLWQTWSPCELTFSRSGQD